jgi:hypothetical protein
MTKRNDFIVLMRDLDAVAIFVLIGAENEQEAYRNYALRGWRCWLWHVWRWINGKRVIK